MSDIPNVKMDISRMSDNEIQELFEKAYASQIGDRNDIDDPEITCERQAGSQTMHMMVNICGFAGTPTSDQYGRSTEGDVTKVNIERFDKGRLTFNLNPSKTTPLGGIDYQVIYESE